MPFFELPNCQLLGPQAPQRAEAEALVARAFLAAHNARIHHFLPLLAGLQCKGQFQAVAGLADANQHSLFVETYLDAPIEAVVEKHLGINCQRHQIIEIGNLASTWKGSSLLLFVYLGELLYRLGYRWSVFTATPQVAKLLARLNFKPQAIADADPKRLPDKGAQWGDYYNTQPQVLLGDLTQAVETARNNRAYRAARRALNAQIEAACSCWQELIGDE